MTRIFRSEGARKAVFEAYRSVLDQWPIPHEERYLSTSQGETFVLSMGDQEAPPLILLHGAQSNSAAWIFDAPQWSRAFRIHAIDRIGDAGFSAPSRPQLDDESYALWLDDVMSGLGLSSASLVGVSLGGWLALEYARRRPDKVVRLALICPAGIGRQKNFLLRAGPLLLLGPWGHQKVRELVFGPAPDNLPAAMRPFADLMGLIGKSVIPQAINIPRLSDAELERLRLPMLVIIGGRDVLIDSDDTRDRLARHAPKADVRYLPEARHFIPGQTDAVLQFLTDQKTSKGA